MTTKWNFRIGSLYLIILCSLLLCSCGNKPGKYIIGVSQCSMDAWREKLNSELKTAEYLNDSVEVRLASADDDNDSQLSQINYFIDGVSVCSSFLPIRCMPFRLPSKEHSRRVFL